MPLQQSESAVKSTRSQEAACAASTETRAVTFMPTSDWAVLAERAYRQAIYLGGETTALLNNRGYSAMLRGDYRAAHSYFLKAYEREPGNPTIANNLKLLDASSRQIERSPEAIPTEWVRR